MIVEWLPLATHCSSCTGVCLSVCLSVSTAGCYCVIVPVWFVHITVDGDLHASVTFIIAFILIVPQVKQETRLLLTNRESHLYKCNGVRG